MDVKISSYKDIESKSPFVCVAVIDKFAKIQKEVRETEECGWIHTCTGKLMSAWEQMGGNILLCFGWISYNLPGIHSPCVMQWKNHLHFFSTSVKYQRRAPAEQRIDRAGRGMNFSAALALPFCFSLFSCRFSRYAAWTRSPCCMRTSQAASSEFHWLREPVPK